MALKNGIEADPWLPMHQNFKNHSQVNQRRDTMVTVKVLHVTFEQQATN